MCMSLMKAPLEIDQHLWPKPGREHLIGPTGVMWLAIVRGVEYPSPAAAYTHSRERGWEGTQKVFTTI